MEPRTNSSQRARTTGEETRRLIARLKESIERIDAVIQVARSREVSTHAMIEDDRDVAGVLPGAAGNESATRTVG